MHCALVQKTHNTPRLRLDTLRQALVCATCMRNDLIKVNLLGRTLRYRQQHFYLCPVCVSIQQYKGKEEQPWMPRVSADGQLVCPHMPGRQPGTPLKQRCLCCICSEPALVHTIERIDHLLGKFQQFHFCQRHMPRLDILIKCVNARQLAAYSPVCRRIGR